MFICSLGTGTDVPRRDSLQSQSAEQIVDYLSGAAGRAALAPGTRAIAGPGPGPGAR